MGSYELASRLSYIVWGGPPDEELLRAAGAGELSDRAKLAAQVKRMLADPRAVDRSLRFAYEWLDLGRLDNLRPNESRYPTWDPQLAMDMREETLAYFKHVVWDQKRPMWDLLNAQVTFATPRLAEHYGLKEDWIAADNSQRDTSDRPRSSKGLIALYTFREGGGDVVRDVSVAGEPLNLKIESVKAVEWSSDGLKVKDTTLIATGSAPRRLIDALKKSNEITLEAWITPADTKQEGPARILTLSQSSSARNFTLGQERDQFDVRFRTTKTSTNGIPSVSTPGKTVETKKVHVAYTRDATGRAKLYIDGQQKAAGNIDGDLGNWDAGMRLALGNELTRDRNWRGTFHRVAIYDRALSQAEIQAQTFGPSRYDLSKFPARGGLLTHGSVLTIGGDDASMVTRGLFVLHDLLRGHVDDPPPGLDTSPVPTKPGQSHRVIAEKRIANPQCGGCHRAFEPLAFGLERYDGIGAYFEKDKHGNRLREDGQIVLPGEDQPKSYRTSAELMDLLAGSDRVRKTLTWKVAQWAMGRPMREADSPLLDTIYADAAKNGGTYESLIAALAMSDLVRMTHTESKP